MMIIMVVKSLLCHTGDRVIHISFLFDDNDDLDDHYGCQEPPSLVQELCVDSGEQLCVLLGFRTTDDNCVDTLEADSERSQVGGF